jgi:hypothetical protein
MSVQSRHSPSSDAIDPAAAEQYLRDLARLWRKADPRSRQELAMALRDGWSFLGFREATYVWSATARRYGLDRLVPPELTISLADLALPGRPTGTFVVRAASTPLELDVASSA